MDPAQRGEFEVVDAPPGAFVLDALGLVEPDQALGLGVEAPMSSDLGKSPFGAQRGADDAEGLASGVALEHAQRVLTTVALLASSMGDVSRPLVVDHAVVRDRPQRVVGLAIPAAAQAVALSLPATGLDGARSAERGEGRVAP